MADRRSPVCLPTWEAVFEECCGPTSKIEEDAEIMGRYAEHSEVLQCFGVSAENNQKIIVAFSYSVSLSVSQCLCWSRPKFPAPRVYDFAASCRQWVSCHLRPHNRKWHRMPCHTPTICVSNFTSKQIYIYIYTLIYVYSYMAYNHTHICYIHIL